MSPLPSYSALQTLFRSDTFVAIVVFWWWFLIASQQVALAVLLSRIKGCWPWRHLPSRLRSVVRGRTFPIHSDTNFHMFSRTNSISTLDRQVSNSPLRSFTILNFRPSISNLILQNASRILLLATIGHPSAASTIDGNSENEK